ncbi:hypothetical protein AB4Y30_17205 [Ornithinibacillus sp. 4-3]|uniref:DUF4083 domain-containing protein n=1 Tax=Ornithinibacillus sp. 4-3 TaxID=3231488 RepID=A0AB39HKR5_9BACI
MEVLLIFIAIPIILIFSIFVLIRGVKKRVNEPTNQLKEEVANLEKRVNDLEVEKDR